MDTYQQEFLKMLEQRINTSDLEGTKDPVQFFQNLNRYWGNKFLEGSFDERYKANILLETEEIEDSYLERIYDKYLRQTLEKMTDENREETKKKIETYCDYCKDIEKISSIEDRLSYIETIDSKEMHDNLLERYSRITGQRAIDKINEIATKLTSRYEMRENDLIAEVNREFPGINIKMKEKDDFYRRRDTREIFESKYIIEAFQYSLKGASNQEKTEFYIDILKNVNGDNINFIEDILKFSKPSEEIIYEVIRRQDEYQNEENYVMESIKRVLQSNISYLQKKKWIDYII